MIKKVGYLTIDDGPCSGFIEKVDFLESKGIKALWFCLEREFEKYENDVLYAIKKGHIIGNHSFNHPHFSEINLEDTRSQILKTDEMLERVYQKSGIKRPMKMFRFPFLDKGARQWYDKLDLDHEHVHGIQQILREFGYRQPEFENINYAWYKKAKLHQCADVDCTFITFDWVLVTGENRYGYHDLNSILKRIDEDAPEEGKGINYNGSNDIILMHATIPPDAFQVLIEKFITKGMTFKLPGFIA